MTKFAILALPNFLHDTGDFLPYLFDDKFRCFNITIFRVTFNNGLNLCFAVIHGIFTIAST